MSQDPFGQSSWRVPCTAWSIDLFPNHTDSFSVGAEDCTSEELRAVFSTYGVVVTLAYLSIAWHWMAWHIMRGIIWHDLAWQRAIQKQKHHATEHICLGYVGQCWTCWTFFATEVTHVHVTPAMFRNWRRLCRREGKLGEVWSCVKFFGLQIEFLS